VFADHVVAVQSIRFSRKDEQPGVKRHLALVGLLLAAAGCASSSSTGRHHTAAASSDAVSITVNDEFRFEPARVTVKAGDITLRLVASGSYPHNLALPEMHQTSATVGTSVGYQHTTLLRLHDVRPGVYRFLCTFHSKAGMTGELVVR
jgi:plastocyanin